MINPQMMYVTPWTRFQYFPSARCSREFEVTTTGTARRMMRSPASRNECPEILPIGPPAKSPVIEAVIESERPMAKNITPYHRRRGAKNRCPVRVMRGVIDTQMRKVYSPPVPSTSASVLVRTSFSLRDSQPRSVKIHGRRAGRARSTSAIFFLLTPGRSLAGSFLLIVCVTLIEIFLVRVIRIRIGITTDRVRSAHFSCLFLPLCDNGPGATDAVLSAPSSLGGTPLPSLRGRAWLRLRGCLRLCGRLAMRTRLVVRSRLLTRKEGLAGPGRVRWLPGADLARACPVRSEHKERKTMQCYFGTASHSAKHGNDRESGRELTHGLSLPAGWLRCRTDARLRGPGGRPSAPWRRFRAGRSGPWQCRSGGRHCRHRGGGRCRHGFDEAF